MDIEDKDTRNKTHNIMATEEKLSFGNQLRRDSEQALIRIRKEAISEIKVECQTAAGKAQRSYLVPSKYIDECQFDTSIQMRDHIGQYIQDVEVEAYAYGVVISW